MCDLVYQFHLCNANHFLLISLFLSLKFLLPFDSENLFDLVELDNYLHTFHV